MKTEKDPKENEACISILPDASENGSGLNPNHCGCRGCVIVNKNLENMRRAAVKYKKKCIASYVLLVLIILLGITSLVLIFTSELTKQLANDAFFILLQREPQFEEVSSFDPKKVFDSEFTDSATDVIRLNAIMDSFLGEEVFQRIDKSGKIIHTRYFTFKEPATRRDALAVCSRQSSTLLNLESKEEEHIMDNFILELVTNGLFHQPSSTTSEKSMIKFWTGGFYNLSSEYPQNVWWEGPNGPVLGSDFAEPRILCDKNRTRDEICIGPSECHYQTKKDIFDVLKDFRPIPNDIQAGCWTPLRRTDYQEDKHFFMCEAPINSSNPYYDPSPDYVSQRYSENSKMFFKFYSSKQSLIDAKQICEDDGARLLTFNNEIEDDEFDDMFYKNRNKILRGVNFTDPKETIQVFTSGLGFLCPGNAYEAIKSFVDWGRNNPLVTSKVAYLNGKTNRIRNCARDEKDYELNTSHCRILVLVKDFTGRLTDQELVKKSCWRGLTYDTLKNTTVKHYFACQTRKLEKVTYSKRLV